MGILEAVFIGFFAAVGGITFLTEPTDIAIDDIYIPDFEEQGLKRFHTLGGEFVYKFEYRYRSIP